MQNFKLHCANKILDLASPKVMGILNITPNSYSDVGRFLDPQQALVYAQQIVAEGASIIDVGGEPTSPGLNPCIPLQQELDRVMPVLELLTRELDAIISVDTSKPEVMQEAIKLGVGIINDVRGLRAEGALSVIAQAKVAVCLMHMAYPDGKPETIAEELYGNDVVGNVKTFLQSRIEACIAVGISRDRLLIDPGIGHYNFGKNTQQNILLLNQLSAFSALKVPILVGVSRKVFVGEILDLPHQERLYGSLGAAIMAICNGASILRVHDVKATVQALKVANAIREADLAIP